MKLCYITVFYRAGSSSGGPSYIAGGRGCYRRRWGWWGRWRRWGRRKVLTKRDGCRGQSIRRGAPPQLNKKDKKSMIQ
ncbi:hypothetical protein FHG87_022642 [Trinorchestia longiramus]|nr:hypothetical protein FHG87_022642 [Trinorchestia longiramus]